MKHDRDLILAEVRERFSQRGRRPGRISRAELRKLALRAVDAGHSPGVVAAAAGVSRQSILNWRKCITRAIAPVELHVVEPIPVVTNGRTMDGVGRLHLRSGAVLELPLSFVDARLFALLNGGAS